MTKGSSQEGMILTVRHQGYLKIPLKKLFLVVLNDVGEGLAGIHRSLRAGMPGCNICSARLWGSG